MPRDELATLRRARRGTPSWAGPFPASGAAAFQQILALRRQVWRSELGLIDARQMAQAVATLSDEHDVHGLHWVVTAGGEIVAAARLCLHDDAHQAPGWDRRPRDLVDVPAPVATLSRMVVRPDMRRLGFAGLLTDVRIAAARAAGARSVLVEAAPSRVGLFREAGFIDLGRTAAEPWDLAPFQLMLLQLDA